MRRFQHMSIEVLQFSDTLVAFCPLVNVHGCLTLEPVCAFLLCLGRTLLLSLSKQTPLRGAIEIGLAGRFPQTDLYGPVLAAAHRLESKVAEYPRIIVGSNILDCISDPAVGGKDG